MYWICYSLCTASLNRPGLLIQMTESQIPDFISARSLSHGPQVKSWRGNGRAFEMLHATQRSAFACWGFICSSQGYEGWLERWGISLGWSLVGQQVFLKPPQQGLSLFRRNPIKGWRDIFVGGYIFVQVWCPSLISSIACGQTLGQTLIIKVGVVPELGE